MNWLAEEEELISIRATPANVAPVVLGRQQSIVVFYFTVVFVPVAVLLLGVVVWWAAAVMLGTVLTPGPLTGQSHTDSARCGVALARHLSTMWRGGAAAAGSF